ncbi:MAG: hypothetical protein NDI63_02080 [Pseudobdellovibrio sp.]|nr:hypothetical protein [Pseudobdellovibrio sp.]
MTRHQLFKIHPKYVRDTLNSTVEKSDELLAKERELISLLSLIDQNRLYLRYGFRSLRPFCIKALKLSRTQAQRIVTEVRRTQTTFDSGLKHEQVKVSVIETKKFSVLI